MAEIKSILFPTDFTEASLKVIPYAKYLTEKFGAKLTVLFVVEELSKYANFYVPHSALDNLEQELMEHAQKKLTSFIEEHFEDFPVEPLVRRGEIAEEIAKVAEEKETGLILMATHGRKGLEKILIGSVTERVIKIAPCPVMTINPFRVKK
ncbi:UspA domain-containing protein [Thermodesulfatator indicus DSM 15286]|uniref:Universal stress protein n=1 Tax=Thermodesulfatator indicus (strain DSM 15286 / JCM 11887 / CIR29812) TaxID=667014 RepID=F8ADW9_THEID|nr:universal stress protein [Thermodesulfatator indicus]AEH44934.1 UspA domain-containing protein [Thermodesulfatator indicus DSM 15286]